MIEENTKKSARDARGANPSISRIDIQRAGTKLHISVYTARPGVVIGQGGAGVEALKKALEKMTGRQVALDIMEIKNPDTDAQLVADLFIVSKVTVTVGAELAVNVAAAEGKKCERCWKFHVHTNEDGLCPRCAAVVPASEIE